MSLSDEIAQLERVRATWEWTVQNAFIRIQEINADIQALKEAVQDEEQLSGD